MKDTCIMMRDFTIIPIDISVDISPKVKANHFDRNLVVGTTNIANKHSKHILVLFKC